MKESIRYSLAEWASYLDAELEEESQYVTLVLSGYRRLMLVISLFAIPAYRSILDYTRVSTVPVSRKYAAQQSYLPKPLSRLCANFEVI